MEGDTVTMALAALGMGGLWVHQHRGIAAAALIEGRLRDTLGMVDQSSTVALRLRARIAAEADYRSGRHDTILAVLREAKSLGDPTAIAEAVNFAHHCVLGPDHGELRHTLAKELIAEAMRTGRRSDLLMGVMWRMVDLFLDGDPHAGRCLSELRGMLAQKEHLAVGFVADAIDVMQQIREGQLDQAELMAKCCAEAGHTAGDLDAAGWHAAEMVAIRWFQGRIGELLPALRDLVDSPDLSSVDGSHLAALAVAAAAAGQHHQAVGALARLRKDGLTRIPRSSSRLACLFAVAEAASMLDDKQALTVVYDILLPYAHLPAMASLGVACFGSVEHALGVAASGVGANDKAVDHLRAAVRANLALGHWPAATLSRALLAQVLLRRNGRGDPAEARRELDTARRELDTARRDADSLGMSVAHLEPEAAQTGPAARNDRRDMVTCQRDGKRWMVRFGGHTWPVEDSIGMAYIAVLLSNPGYEVSALELAAGRGMPNPAVVDGKAVSAQPFLDEAAVRAYRTRLSALQEEIDEYQIMNDPVRLERAQTEYDWLVSELSSATGLAGRARKFANNEERARISVGKAIRRAVAKVAAVAPAAGAELEATIQTGMKCSYQLR